MNERMVPVAKRRWGRILLAMILSFIILGFLYTPYDPAEMKIIRRFQPPSKIHFFGTDHYGRDVFSRVVVGGRISLIVGIGAVGLGALVGILMGLLGGFYGGKLDEISMRISTSLQALPTILLALLWATIWGPGQRVVMWSIAIGNIPIFLRITRNQVLKVKMQPYVEAARAVGVTDLRILFIHFWPNIRDPLVVQFSASLAGAILVEASLSYLGVGIQPPVPSWGGILREAQSYASVAPWVVVIPGIFIALTVIAFNLVGDSWIHRR